jgi:hypothetical protein
MLAARARPAGLCPAGLGPLIRPGVLVVVRALAGSLAPARIRAVLIRHVIAGFTVLRRGGIAAPRFARFMSGRIVWHWLAHQLVTHAALALASH